MAENPLKLNEDEMLELAEAIQNAVDDYRNFGEQPLSEEFSYLEGMNTDFTAKLVTMVEDLNDSNPDLVEKLEEIAMLTQEVAETLQELDAEGTASLGLKEG